MKKLLCTLILVVSLTSCSSDDQDTNSSGQNTMEGIVKIEMTLDGQDASFDESLLLQVIGDNMDNTDVTGAEWESVERPHLTTKWFSINQTIPNSAVYQTTNKVRSVTFVSIITPTNEAASPQTATLKFYVDGSLKRTEILVINSNTISQINIPFIVNNN